MKTCTGCGATKPLTEFVKDKRSKSGWNARCKPCANKYARERYSRNLEAERARKRIDGERWRYANPEASREKTRRWRERNPERARELATANSRAFRERNPGYHRAWYQRNLESERARARDVQRRWRAANPEGERERKRRYREANIDVVRKRERENTHRRRALQGATSPELAEFMTALVTKPCVYCGATDNITVDHVIPLSRGGAHEAANLAPACYSCNCRKGAKLPDEWDHGEPVVP